MKKVSAHTAEQERAAVIAWHRHSAAWFREQGDNMAMECFARIHEESADRFERGEHIKGGENG